MDFSNLKKWKIIKSEKNIYNIENKNGKIIYIGNLKNKKPNGFGEYISKINSYVGYWKKGFRSGRGYSNYPNGNVYYNGYWKKDLPDGIGIFYYKNKKKMYKGYIKNGKYNGEGTLYYLNGNKRYRGNFLNSKFHGFGILYNEKGSEVKDTEGYWKNGYKNGLCKEYNMKGDLIFEGEYKNNKKNGYGYIYHNNFPEKYTFWINGILIKNPYKPFPKELIFQKELGGGGFGNIDLYKHKKNGKLFAVKSLVEKYKKEEYNLVIQYRNLEFLKKHKVCKPYFLCPYGIFKDNQHIKIVFNYLQGYKTFSDFRKIPLSFKKKKYICSQMIKELNILHNIGMIHSDIKPDNIMIHPKTLKVHIIDFGCAIIIDKENKDKKYDIHGFTERYFNLNLHKKHNFEELKKNDIYAIIKVMYSYLTGNYKNISFRVKFDYIKKNLMMSDHV